MTYFIFMGNQILQVSDICFFCVLLQYDIYYLMTLSNAERARRCWEKQKATGLSHIMK